MAAYRRAFRDVIGARYDPAELDQSRAPVEPARDWLAELAAVTDKPAFDTLYTEARKARAFTGDGGDELQARFAEHADRVKAPPTPPQDLAALSAAITPKPGPGLRSARRVTGD